MLEHLSSAEKPSRVLVLGSTGFVGTHLLALLDEHGIEVQGFGSSDLDLTSPDSVPKLIELFGEDVSLVFISALTPDRGRDVKTLMKNLLMSQHVAEALSQQPCRHLVYVSSDAVYSEETSPLRETSPADPPSFHGVMHITREKILLEAVQRLGTPLARLRVGLLYGTGDTHNGYGPNRFMRTALEEKKIQFFGGGEEKRDHIFVGDACEVIRLCLFRQSIGVLNVVTGRSESFFSVGEIIREALGGEVELVKTPRQNPITHVHFDNTEVLKAFPEFSFRTLAVGLPETVQKVKSS